MTLGLIAVLFFHLQSGTPTQPHQKRVSLSKLERVLVFAVQKEVAASHIGQRKDICLGFNTQLALNEKAILAELHREGLQLHEENYCNKGPQGITIELLSPIHATSDITFEVDVDLGDSNPILQEGAHFATLLRRGTYTVRYEDGFEPELVTYQQYCCSGLIGKKKVSEFCSSYTAAAYHSPQCDQWVVHDPNRVEDIKIAHLPAYHTYSRWILGDQTYILAYRDVDHQPSDMIADVYLASNGANSLVGKIPVYDAVSDVSLLKVTKGEEHDLVFSASCGQLECVFVLHFAEGKAKEIFQYAASKIEIVDGTTPKIVAKSRLANLVEEFVWDSKAKEFKRSREYRWHNKAE
jgi:hypothetical protein